MSKGSNRRPTNEPRFSENYNKIDWSKVTVYKGTTLKEIKISKDQNK